MMMRVRAQAATSCLRSFIAVILLHDGYGVGISSAFLLEPQLLALPLTAGGLKGIMPGTSSSYPLRSKKALQEVDEHTIISPTTVQTNDKHGRSDNVSNADNHPPTLFHLSLKSMLDLNNDGKVDIEDLHVVTNNLKLHCLDVNGDGNIDAEDAKTALSIMALFTALLTSSPLPADAKGGGHGGGGGHGHSSHGRGHGRRSGTPGGGVNSDDDDMGGFYRPNHTLGMKDFQPTVCWQLPEEGEEIHARYEGAKDYVPSTVIEVDKSRCEFKSIPLDDGDGVVVPWTHTQVSNLEVYAIISLFVGVFALDRGFGSFLKSRDLELEFEEFDTVFDRLDKPNSWGVSSSPASGTYTGTATERGTVQTIESTLEFKENGSIKGSGSDSMDGEYTINGHWRQDKEESTIHHQIYLVQWKEYYNRGFHVVVQGVMHEKLWTYGNSTNISNKITGEFTSTREVTGTFELGQWS